MSHKAATGVIAGILLFIGILLGQGHHSIPFPTSSQVGDTIDCGTPWHAAPSAQTVDVVSGGQTSYGTQCSDALQTPRIVSFTLSGVGGIALLYVLLISAKKVDRKPQPADASAAAPDDVTT